MLTFMRSPQTIIIWLLKSSVNTENLNGTLEIIFRSEVGGENFVIFIDSLHCFLFYRRIVVLLEIVIKIKRRNRRGSEIQILRKIETNKFYSFWRYEVRSVA